MKFPVTKVAWDTSPVDVVWTKFACSTSRADDVWTKVAWDTFPVDVIWTKEVVWLLSISDGVWKKHNFLPSLADGLLPSLADWVCKKHVVLPSLADGHLPSLADGVWTKHVAGVVTRHVAAP